MPHPIVRIVEEKTGVPQYSMLISPSRFFFLFFRVISRMYPKTFTRYTHIHIFKRKWKLRTVKNWGSDSFFKPVYAGVRERYPLTGKNYWHNNNKNNNIIHNEIHFLKCLFSLAVCSFQSFFFIFVNGWCVGLFLRGI